MVLGIDEGNLEISLDKNAYEPGEVIHGHVRLILQEPEHARSLYVVFYGEETKKDGKKTYIEREYEVKKILDVEKTYQNGEAYEFEILTPNISLPPRAEGIIVSEQNYAPKPGPSAWFIHATLDIPLKIDFNTRKQVSILSAMRTK